MKRKPVELDLPAAEGEQAPEAVERPLRENCFPVVGVGASAGGLAAFEAFFSGMPADTDPGMAFVLVQHLAPDHKSLLTDLIRHYTRMQVFEVEDGMVVQPNCAYIIPPNRDMAFLHGALHLLEPAAPRGQRLPIDFFFRSLALDQRERAIGVVLSGTGGDGTLGVRAIKGEGGMAMAQTPASTEYDGMPRGAIGTGLVDYELPPAEMPAQLIAYVARAFGKPPRIAAEPEPKAENALRKIFILLRAQTGHDFSQYKPSTIHRRVERRLVVHRIETLDDYVKFLQRTPAEVEALFRDLLIGVTSFFRDPEVFAALEKEVIPKLFASKPAGGVVRVWVAGCSTGEEAYSIAILLQEHMEALKQGFTAQVFATDIDARAVATARAGRYPASVGDDLSPERLTRFFTADASGDMYRIHKSIRDMLVFSEQDVVKDPPFSRIDLVSCRNLLIYLGGDLQKRLIPLFHYALNPGGFLCLGTSETVGEFCDLFAPLGHKAKLYQRKEYFRSARRAAPSQLLPLPPGMDAGRPPGAGKTASPAKLPLRELAEQAFLRLLAPSGALVNSQGDILYLYGRTGMYLEPAPGDISGYNILKMARDGLRRELSIALRKTTKTKELEYHPGLRVKTNGHFTLVNLSVLPVNTGLGADLEPPLYLVLLEEAKPSDMAGGDQPAAGCGQGPDADARVDALKQELRVKDEYLQSANEELETSNEELQSANEELQSTNEEMQSSNEELETSKEELQSVNEELSTVNAELQTKLSDLSQANNDMNNLLSGTGIATVFVDHQLRVLRFTPTATQIINLISGDVGRPVGHVVSNLVGYHQLVADAQSVLDSLVPKEVELQTTAGNWYTMRIQPYRTLENVIEGAVLTFVDVTETVRTRDLLRQANEMLRLAVVVRDSRDAITVQALDGRTLAWNPGAARLYGWSEAEALAMNVRDRIPEDLREEALSKAHQLSLAEVLEPYHTRRLAKNGAVVEVSMTSTALLNKSGKVYAVATTERPKEPKLDQASEALDGEQ